MKKAKINLIYQSSLKVRIKHRAEMWRIEPSDSPKPCPNVQIRITNPPPTLGNNEDFLERGKPKISRTGLKARVQYWKEGH